MRGVYLVTDRKLCLGRPLEEVILQALQGGAAYVQLREKEISTREFIDEAITIKKMLNSYQVPLIINDRIDVALASCADGVHLGQEDMPYEIARRLLGPKAIIGLSVETWPDVEEAQSLDLAYIGVSPIFATPTKTDTKEPWGLDGLKRISSYCRHPLVAIGGINDQNAESVVAAGAGCLAVVSAICSSDDPRAATERIKEVIDRHTI
jgi:thiamine-phosphate pyrophosphorylase